MRRIALFAALVLALTAASPARSQVGNTTGFVTTTCGTISPVFVAGRAGPFVVDVNGNLCVNGTFTGSVTVTFPTIGAAVPGTGVYNGINIAGTLRGWTGVNPSGSIYAGQIDLAAVAGVTTATGNGVVGTGVQRVAIASDNTAFSVNAIQSGTWTVQPGNTPNTTAWLVSLAPGSAAGNALTPVVTSAVATNLVLKAAAGNLYSLNVSADSTLSATAWWIMIHNATSAPGNGAVTPLKCYAMASGTTSASFAFPTPIRFSTGISVTVSTNGCFTQADSAHAFISGDVQ